MFIRSVKTQKKRITEWNQLRPLSLYKSSVDYIYTGGLLNTMYKCGLVTFRYIKIAQMTTKELHLYIEMDDNRPVGGMILKIHVELLSNTSLLHK